MVDKWAVDCSKAAWNVKLGIKYKFEAARFTSINLFTNEDWFEMDDTNGILTKTLTAFYFTLDIRIYIQILFPTPIRGTQKEQRVLSIQKRLQLQVCSI